MSRYKAITVFDYYRRFNVGETVELDSNEYLRLAHCVCPIPEYSEPISTNDDLQVDNQTKNQVNKMDDKPNKLYKRGRRKKI